MSDAPARASYPGWQGILDPDETILWQGQPDRRIRIEKGDLMRMLPGLGMLLFALFWVVKAMQTGEIFWIFGLLFVAIGLREALTPVIWPAYLRSRTWYTLTDRRAITATDIPVRGKRLVTYPINPQTPVEFVPGDPPSILFGPDARDARNRPGFRFIPDADRVMEHLRHIQRAALAPSEQQKEWGA